jgi:hypothetical protein
LSPLEPTLSKIPEKIHLLPAASRRKRRPASQKNCFYIFILRAPIFSSKRKKQFFCSAPR